MKNNNWDLVKLLVNKSDLILKNKEGFDPIELASKMKFIEVFNILIEELNAREERAKTNSKEIYEEASKKEKKEKNFTGILSESTSPLQNEIYDREENEYYSDKEGTPITNKINENIQNSVVNLSQKNLFEGNYKNIQYPPNYYPPHPHPNQGYMMNNNNNNLMNVNQMQGFYGQSMPQNYPSNMPPSFQGGQNMNQKKGQNYGGNSYNNQSTNNNSSVFPNNPNPSSFNNPSYNYNVPNIHSKKIINPPAGINLHLADNNKVVITKSIPNYSNYSINIPFDFNYKKLKGENSHNSTGQLGEYISNNELI